MRKDIKAALENLQITTIFSILLYVVDSTILHQDTYQIYVIRRDISKEGYQKWSNYFCYPSSSTSQNCNFAHVFWLLCNSSLSAPKIWNLYIKGVCELWSMICMIHNLPRRHIHCPLVDNIDSTSKWLVPGKQTNKIIDHWVNSIGSSLMQTIKKAEQDFLPPSFSTASFWNQSIQVPIPTPDF